MTTTTREPPRGGLGPAREASEHVKSYRYLRIAMAMLLLGIGIAVVLEWNAVGRQCLQGSISAYYYTPVRAFFVSAVLAIGVCMVALRGTTWGEETALNVSGMLAPVVALVPTSAVGGCSSDGSLGRADPGAVANNMHALLLTAPLCVAYAAVLARVARRKGKAVPRRPSWQVVLPAAALWLTTYLVFLAGRDLFLDHGHGVAAVLLFGGILAVVVLNALGLARKSAEEPGRSEYANRYSALAVLMLLSAAGLTVAGLALDWGHWVFVLEATLLVLFLMFWTVQTEELWDEAVRVDDPRALPTADGAAARSTAAGTTADSAAAARG